MKTIRVVAAIIQSTNKDGEPVILATQRGYGQYKDWWEFPGGKIEDGETPEQALIREICEELTAIISVNQYLVTVEYDYPTFHLSMDCFWCSLAEGHLTLLEHEAAKWLPLSNLRQVNWLPADVIAVDAIENRINKNKEHETIDYYELNAKAFTESTLCADMHEAQNRFLAQLSPGAIILDFGCGAGRDTKRFRDLGFRVEAVDGSEKLCRIASEWAGIDVRHMLFHELSATEKYDGIWACASILHLEKPELKNVMQKIIAALKVGGVLYASFKYGSFEGMRSGRYFTDFTNETLEGFIQEFSSLETIEQWITQDVRPGRKEEQWINILAKRI